MAMEEEFSGSDVQKKFLYVNRRAPYGTIYALESLEVVLIGAALTRMSHSPSSTTASTSSSGIRTRPRSV